MLEFGVIAALGLAPLALFVSYWALRRTRLLATSSHTLRRLARNSVLPIVAGLFNKALDMALALVMLRILQPEGVGQYTVAVVLVGYFEILITFGLSTLTTREVARSPAEAHRYFATSLALRLCLWLICLPAVWVLTFPLGPTLNINTQVTLAIWVLVLAMLPNLVASGISALFMAHERADVPAAVSVATTGLKVLYGLTALFAGFGYVGLAAVALIVNSFTALLLWALFSALLYPPRFELQPGLARTMLILAYPLMLNNLLNSLFFRIDALMLNPLAGEAAVGYYGAAYKIIDGLLVISSSFVLAAFPLLSRYAQEPAAQLRRAHDLALKLLLAISLPLAAGGALLAEPIMRLFAGSSYLPHSALALAVLVWMLPFSFTNGLAQYVLIAVNRQRFLTLAFALVTVFNVGANLVLIPRFSYLAAALTTVLSELVLLGPFWWAMSRELGGIPLLRSAWRPLVASALMGAAIWPLREPLGLAAVPLGAAVYLLAFLGLRGLLGDELELIERALGVSFGGGVRRLAGVPSR